MSELPPKHDDASPPSPTFRDAIPNATPDNQGSCLRGTGAAIGATTLGFVEGSYLVTKAVGSLVVKSSAAIGRIGAESALYVGANVIATSSDLYGRIHLRAGKKIDDWLGQPSNSN